MARDNVQVEGVLHVTFSLRGEKNMIICFWLRNGCLNMVSLLQLLICCVY